EVGREVDDLVGPALQVGGQLLRHAVGQSQEDEVEAVGQAGVVRLEPRARVGGRQARVQVGDLRSRLRLPHGPGQLELGVLEAKAKKLSPRVAGGSDDADSIHGSPSYGRLNNDAKTQVTVTVTAPVAHPPDVSHTW